MDARYATAAGVLRQIASIKRKTKEQRLASSAIGFLDAMEAEARKSNRFP